MSKPEHPLRSNEQWLFRQPATGFSTAYFFRRSESNGRKEVQVTHTCREGLISNTREALQAQLVEKRRQGARSWDVQLVQVGHIDWGRTLDDGLGQTFLLLSGNEYIRPLLQEPTEFLHVADALVGNVSLLLHPKRKPGDWWKTTVKDAKGSRTGYLAWKGASNFFLEHPVLISVMTGLYRQAAILCKAGCGPEVLKCVSPERTEEALTEASWKKALANTSDLRTWIEVPVPRNDSWEGHFPFPLGFWRRFMRLQRAARRHPYTKIFGEDFGQGWGITEKSNSRYTGAFSFWGQTGEFTEAHHRLMELGRPLRRKRRVNRGAQSIT